MPPSSPVVLITGCSSGIGLALAQEFASRQCRVIASSRSLPSLEVLRDHVSEVLALDVTDEEAIRDGVALIKRRYGRIDVLINNAGYGLMAPLMDVTPSAMDAQFRTNVYGPLELARRVAPLMRRQGSGVIANIGSISGVTPTPFAGPYCASKAAINAVSDVLRMELAPFGIHVVSVQPGAIRSAFGDTASRGTALMGRESWYAAQLQHVAQRAGSSQENAMPAAQFARRLADALLRTQPPAVLRIGPKSRLLPAIKTLLPERLLDRVLRRRFGLAQVALE